MDLLTGCLLVALLVIVIWNWKRTTAAADDLGNVMNDLPFDHDLSTFKKYINLKISILENKVEQLEKGRSSPPPSQEDRPAANRE